MLFMLKANQQGGTNLVQSSFEPLEAAVDGGLQGIRHSAVSEVAKSSLDPFCFAWLLHKFQGSFFVLPKPLRYFGCFRPPPGRGASALCLVACEFGGE